MIRPVDYLRIRLAAKAKTERGASAVEYGLLVALIAITIIVAVSPSATTSPASSTRPPTSIAQRPADPPGPSRRRWSPRRRRGGHRRWLPAPASAESTDAALRQFG